MAQYTPNPSYANTKARLELMNLRYEMGSPNRYVFRWYNPFDENGNLDGHYNPVPFEGLSYSRALGLAKFMSEGETAQVNALKTLRIAIHNGDITDIARSVVGCADIGLLDRL